MSTYPASTYYDLRVMAGCLLLVCCGWLVGCDERPAASPATAPATPSNEPLLIQRMFMVIRENVSKMSNRDPEMISRIDEILLLLRREGPEALRREPRVIVAAVDDDGVTTGVNRLMVHAVTPLADVQRLEIIDADGVVVGINSSFGSKNRLVPGKFNATWGANRDEQAGLQMVTAVAYLAPSLSGAPSPTVIDGKLEQVFEVTQLPMDWGRRKLAIRMVLDNGQQTNAVSLWKWSEPGEQRKPKAVPAKATPGWKQVLSEVHWVRVGTRLLTKAQTKQLVQYLSSYQEYVPKPEHPLSPGEIYTPDLPPMDDSIVIKHGSGEKAVWQINKVHGLVWTGDELLAADPDTARKVVSLVADIASKTQTRGQKTQIRGQNKRI